MCDIYIPCTAVSSELLIVALICVVFSRPIPFCCCCFYVCLCGFFLFFFFFGGGGGGGLAYHRRLCYKPKI